MQQLEIAAPFPALSCVGPDTRRVIDNPPGGSKYLGYKRVTDSVDAVYQCEHVNEARSVFSGKLEMSIHNRTSGKTCFFEDNEQATEESVNVPALTASNARSFWRRGSTQFGSRDEPACADCHTTGGPYIIGPESVAAMEQFGLINNRHDTFFNIFRTVNADQTVEQRENDKMRAEPAMNCGAGCHNLRSSNAVVFAASDLTSAGLMPPSDRYSLYRSINRDTPNGTGDVETLEFVKTEYPHFHCENPMRIRAHMVGSTRRFESNGPMDRLRKFNLRDGLECVNADQPNGVCADYQVRYMCNGTWSSWYNLDSPNNSGDFERRSEAPNLCANPTAIQSLHYTRGETGSMIPSVMDGPNDRLHQFNNKGLICRNADQGAAQTCSNYVVKFICP